VTNTLPALGHSLPDAPSLSVLIVDDNLDAADSLAEVLRLYGFGVHVAYGPDSALAAEQADVVLLELRLAGISGWELVRRMRAAATARPSPFVAVTTCGSKDDRRRSDEAGIDLHLVKPVEPTVLVEALRRYERVLA